MGHEEMDLRSRYLAVRFISASHMEHYLSPQPESEGENLTS
jgi:hypothetical protein